MGNRSCWRVNSRWMAVLCLIFPVLSWAGGNGRVFVLEDSDRGLLCAFTRESDWAGVPKQQDVEFTAIAESVDGVLKTVLVERDTEDTSTHDEYAVGREGRIRQLRRTLGVVPQRVSREQIWTIRDTQPVKVSESWLEFKTHKPVRPDARLDYIIEHTIIVRVNDFPFYPLIVDEHPERWPDGKRCLPGNMTKLELPINYKQ